MATDMAEARGRVMMRPWRVGVLADTSSAEAVRETIAKLSAVWGGLYMPILDVATPVDELERIASQYDVDSLYGDEVGGDVRDLISKPGWSWGARGPWGPFGEEAGFRKGLLPLRAFIGGSKDLIQPVWDPADPADLIHAANWGLADQLGLAQTPNSEASGFQTIPHEQVLTAPRLSNTVIGAVAATAMHVRAEARDYLEDLSGIYVVREDTPVDVVDFWNMRTYGLNVIAVPALGSEELLRLLLGEPLPASEARPGTGESKATVRVWGLDDASAGTRQAILAAAGRDGLSLWQSARGDFPRFPFQGLRTAFTRSLRADFRSESLWFEIGLPSLPISDEPDVYARGVVAAEIHLHDVRGQDPRLTASMPPYRRHSELVRRVAAGDEVDRARTTTSGLAIGVDADRDHVRVPFLYNHDAMHLLFDDESVTTAQSDIGKFQTRAAEKFGGMFSGVFNQPGVRAAVELAAGKVSGVTISHLRNVVEQNKGPWPDPLFARRLDGREYARRQVDLLLHSGLFVPTLKIHCSHCRVESRVSADDLATLMTCEFCGQSFNLALSHSLAQPEWRYRLAAHLRADQVQALMPALAVTSFLSQLRHVEEPPIPHMLGLEVTLEGVKTEVDVAAYLPEWDWTAVLGEVKSANRIDGRDITNLEGLQRKLRSKAVRCLLLFATLKAELSTEERLGLRGLVERSELQQLTNGRLFPILPLVLTGPDLSHAPGSREHPWNWDSHNYAGVFGTAISSCQRNLGLQSHTILEEDGHLKPKFTWKDD